jgi:peptidoglycan/xylan/chitin deacetylase (PgdA/CDA1 family)
MNHVNLGKQHTADELAHEIVDDKAVMEKTVGKPLRFFAYPFGSVKNLHADSISVIRRAGYKAAFTIVPSFLSSARDPYSLGRDSLLLEDSNGIWLARLRGGYDFVSRLKNTFLS